MEIESRGNIPPINGDSIVRWWTKGQERRDQKKRGSAKEGGKHQRPALNVTSLRKKNSTRKREIGPQPYCEHPLCWKGGGDPVADAETTT